jgi:hypothetical protein
MQRLIYYLLALVLAGGSAYLYLTNANRSATAQGPSGPRERLDSVRKVAKDIEQDTQKRIDDLAKRSQ